MKTENENLKRHNLGEEILNYDKNRDLEKLQMCFSDLPSRIALYFEASAKMRFTFIDGFKLFN